MCVENWKEESSESFDDKTLEHFIDSIERKRKFQKSIKMVEVLLVKTTRSLSGNSHAALSKPLFRKASFSYYE